MDITREEFQAYEELRQSGEANMFGRHSHELCGLTRERYMAVLQNYDKCVRKWPDVKRFVSSR